MSIRMLIHISIFLLTVAALPIRQDLSSPARPTPQNQAFALIREARVVTSPLTGFSNLRRELLSRTPVQGLTRYVRTGVGKVYLVVKWGLDDDLLSTFPSMSELLEKESNKLGRYSSGRKPTIFVLREQSLSSIQDQDNEAALPDLNEPRRRGGMRADGAGQYLNRLTADQAARLPVSPAS